MGSCFSCCEEEDDHHVPSARPVYETRRRRPAPAPAPTASLSWSNYESSRNHYNAVPSPSFRSVPVQHRVPKPNVRPAVVIKPTREFKAVPSSSFRSVPVQHRVPKPNVRPALVIKPTQEFKPRPGALYGEYKCGCGYFWVSRLSWRDKYQKCKRCRADVRPKNQRELRPSDFPPRDNLEGLEHPQHLCEMCKQVGGYCGKNNKPTWV